MPRISAQLSDEARRGWDRTTTNHTVTLSGLLEAIGLLLDERALTLPPETIARAVLVDRERYNRP